MKKRLQRSLHDHEFPPTNTVAAATNANSISTNSTNAPAPAK